MPTIVSSYIKTSGSVDTRAGDSISFPLNIRPQPITIYLRFQERGTTYLQSSQRLLTIGSASAGVLIRSDWFTETQRRFGMIHIEPTPVGTRQVTLLMPLASAPNLGQICELVGQVQATGDITLYQSIQGAAATSATAGATARFTADNWTTITVNASAGTSNSGVIALLNLLVVRGVQDIITMRRLADVP